MQPQPDVESDSLFHGMHVAASPYVLARVVRRLATRSLTLGGGSIPDSRGGECVEADGTA